MTTERKVLVVDDDRSQLAIMVEALRDVCRPIVAKHGEQALQLAASQQPALILLDVVMPEMDGYEVCRRLQANPGLAEIPVLMVTSLVEISAIERGLAAGAIDFVHKPVQPLLLRARVRTYLEWAQLRSME